MKTRLSLALLCVLLACGRDPATDPWERNGGSIDWPALPQTDLVAVTDWYTANQLVEEVSWLALTDEQLFRLTGQRRREGAGRPYLLRSVGYSPNGGYNVSYSGTQVQVVNGTNGHQDRIFRRPVVAYLAFEPTELFVSCFSDL